MISESSTVLAVQELAEEIGPDQVLVSGPAFDDSLHIWNGAVQHRPALVVRTETPADVQTAVRAAHRFQLPPSVRGGGHDWAGRALRSDGLVIDLKSMRRGRQYAIRARSVPTYSADVVAALAEAGSTRTSPLSGISIHHFHGAASRVPIEATAFGIRQNHLVVEIVAAWEPDDANGARHQAWTASVPDGLAPSALPGGYANLLGPHAYDQIAYAYGPDAARLRAAKARFDAAGMFSAIPLPGISEE
jgi:hypothetical protein